MIGFMLVVDCVHDYRLCVLFGVVLSIDWFVWLLVDWYVLGRILCECYIFLFVGLCDRYIYIYVI